MNSEGVLLAASPDKLNIIGNKLLSAGPAEALEAKKPLVSTPYLSTLGNFEILISSPIFNSSGKYLGYIGGIIYLKEKSILNDLLGRHFHQDGSYVYVSDTNKNIIYHPEAARIGYQVEDNQIANHSNKKTSGSKQITNASGAEMLVGYAALRI